MELRKILTLRGPSIWGLSPALEAWVDDQPIAGLDVNSPAVHALWKPRLVELTAALSTCASTTGASEPRHATPADLADETELPRILARVAAEAQATLVGREPQVHVARLERDHAYQAVFHYQDENAGRRCLDFAVEFCGAVLAGTSLDLPARLLQLAQAIENGKPAAGVRAICSAAIARGVPVMKTHAGDVLQLGWGSRQHRLTGLTTDRTAALSASFLADPNVTWKMLQAAGVPMYDPDETVPAANYRVLVDTQRWIAAIKLNDATSSWHDAHEPVIADLITQLTEGARMLGLHVAEFALAVPDLTEPLDGKQRGVVSVSAKPDVEAFCAASPELARRVGQAVVDGLLPNNQSGRIPVIAVTGTNGKTTTTRLCAHIVAMAGKRVGMTCTDGIYINGRRIDTDDCSGPRSARNVLMNPTVDAAVLETARGGILREGLAFDRCDVAVVTNIGEGDHLGLNGVHTKDQIARVKRVIADAVAPHGVAVLKADDPLTAAMAPHCPGAIVFFCLDGLHPVIVEHRSRGGRVVFVRDNSVVLAEGDLEFPLLSLDRIPLTHKGRILFQVENVLSSTAANWALGIPAEVIRNGLETFSSSVDKSPGRFNLLEINGATVVVDYGHNTSSLQAMLQTLALFPHKRRLAVYSAAGDRRDIDMVQQGEMLGQAFDRVILYEDQYMRGREPGEIMALFQQGLKAGGRVTDIVPVQGWNKAVDDVLLWVQPGDLVLLQADTIDEAVNVVKQLMATDAQTREVNLKEALRTASDSTPKL